MAVCTCFLLTPESASSLCNLMEEQARPCSWWVSMPPEQLGQRGSDGLLLTPGQGDARATLVNPAPCPEQGRAGPSLPGKVVSLRSVRTPVAVQQGAERLPWSSYPGFRERGSSLGPGQEINRALGFPKIKLHIFTIIALDIFPHQASRLHPDKHI